MVDYVTQDVDMMVRSRPENTERILSALAELGADVSTAAMSDLQARRNWTRRADRSTF